MEQQDLDAFKQSLGWRVREGELEEAEAERYTRSAEHAVKLVRQLKAQLKPGERVRNRFTIGDILELSRVIGESHGRSPSEIAALQYRVLRAMITLS